MSSTTATANIDDDSSSSDEGESLGDLRKRKLAEHGAKTKKRLKKHTKGNGSVAVKVEKKRKKKSKASSSSSSSSETKPKPKASEPGGASTHPLPRLSPYLAYSNRWKPIWFAASMPLSSSVRHESVRKISDEGKGV